MKKMIYAGLLAGAVAVAGPASAATFAGDFGEPDFSYGTLTSSGFSAYMAYATGASECLGLGACYRGADTYAIIAKAASSSELLAHPGPDSGGNSAILYKPGTDGYYTLSSLASSYDSGKKSVGYFTIIGGVLSTFVDGTIFGGAPTATGGGSAGGTQAVNVASVHLGSNDSIGVFVNNFDGDYHGDTTHFSGTISAVPEPATWAMMLGGFGLVGFGMRRRRKAAVGAARGALA